MKYRGLALAAAVGLIVVACSGDDATTGSNATGGASSGAAGKAGASTQGTSGDANGGTSAPGNPGGGVGGEGAGAGGLGAAGRKSAGAAGDTDAAGGTGGSPLQTDPEPPGGAGAGGAGCVPGVIPMPFEVEPVDIIFVIDNSPSMAPAVAQLSAGLNAFAAQLAAKKLDYKLIALSVRAKTNPVNIDGSARYGICVPPPLAGDDNCGNGPRFFQSDVNVTSTQLLEQFLGTLGQTTGYTVADKRGGPAWKEQLRPSSSRHIVVVTDDNARLSADDFENFAGGPNPFNSNLSLPPGLLATNGPFSDFMFHGVYGWGSIDDPDVACTYPDQSKPSPGAVYSELVLNRGGVRAQICYGASLWETFFASLTSVAAATSRVICSFPVPDVPFDPDRLQLRIDAGLKQTNIGSVGSLADCGPLPQFAYDDWDHPTRMLLCGSACDKVNAVVGPNRPGKLSAVVECL